MPLIGTLHRDSLAMRLWSWCDNFQDTVWFSLDYQSPALPQDLCSLVRMYGGGLRALLIYGAVWALGIGFCAALIAGILGVLGGVGFLGYLGVTTYAERAPELGAAKTLWSLLRDCGIGAIVAGKGLLVLLGICAAAGAAGWGVIILIGLCFEGTGALGRRLTGTGFAELLSLFGQWLYGLAHGVCFTIKVVE
ncbi:MAG: hypothetical protein JWL88_175 [Parcubacteria group bacterium]|nr:hypothetical protein [Parcubacteria group bacterium]